jgi:hypothetical protein
MVEGKRSKEYNEGYKDAIEDLKDEQNLKLFMEGYKSGFSDGYTAAREELKMMMMSNLPPEIRQQMEEGAEAGGWRWPW